MKNKKFYQRLISAVLTLVILCSVPLNVSAAQHQFPMEETNASDAAVKYIWKAAFQIVKWVLIKGDNSFFNRSPEIREGENWSASSSGSVAFGNGANDVRRVKFTTNVSTAHNHLSVFAQTSVTGWLEKISIFIEDRNGNEIAGGQVTHDQHVLTSYDLPLNTYTTYYVYNKNRNWDCWIYRYDFSADYLSRTKNTTSGQVADMVYNPYTQKSYIIPSDFSSTSFRSRSRKNGNVLTAQDLVNEFYDRKLNCSVSRMKNYDIGDTVYVNDSVVDLEYDNANNITTIYLGNTTEGAFAWPFTGDLRNQIKVNDQLTFKFNVVEEYSTNEYSFETLDYLYESYGLINNNTAANINDYLVA